MTTLASCHFYPAAMSAAANLMHCKALAETKTKTLEFSIQIVREAYASTEAKPRNNSNSERFVTDMCKVVEGVSERAIEDGADTKV